MTETSDAVRRHYQAGIEDRDALLSRLAVILDGMAGPLDAARLASIDQFHVGGLTATVELAKRIGVAGGARVLDAGAGLGGPSRYLAREFDCRVEAVDLAPDYVAIASLLTERAGLSGQVSHRVADLTSLPYEDASFDLVWTQHVVMNIADRDALYREIRRVIRPGGRFAFYDPIAADGHPDLHYPVPWAETAETTTLLTTEETKAVLERAGLPIAIWEDVSDEALGWLDRQQQAGPPPTLNGGLVVGQRMGPMVANFARNLREERVRLAMGCCAAA